MHYKPIPIKDSSSLLIEHQAILSGVRKGLSYRKMAKVVGKSLGMVQIYVIELEEFGALKRTEKKRGMGKKLMLTEKGEDICKRLCL